MDIRREDLDAAVEAGVIDARSRERLIAFAQQRLQGAGPDNESFRLLTGFNDIFVALACLLVWRWRRARLQPDASAPYYRKLFARFDALAPALAFTRGLAQALPGAGLIATAMAPRSAKPTPARRRASSMIG